MSKKSKTDHSGFLKKRRNTIAVIVAIVVSITLITPPVYYGGFTVRVGIITFDETTSATQTVLTPSGLLQRLEAHNVYDYTYSLEAGGAIRTSDTLVSSSQGTVRIEIQVAITTPSARVLNSTRVTIDGGLGTRSHTVYLGPAEGMRDPGLYAISITVSATTNPSSSGPRTATITIPHSPLLFILPSS